MNDFLPFEIEEPTGPAPRRSEFRILALVFVLVLLRVLVEAVRASEPAPTLSLVNPTQVDGAGIFLDQVLAASPPAAVPHVRLAPAPAVGQTASLARTQVVQWVRLHAPELVSTNWTGADRVRVTRAARALDEVEVRELVRQTLQRDLVKDRGELELRLLRPWASVQIPDEPLTLRVVDLPATGVGPNFVLRFELLSGTERVGSWQLVASAKVWREVPVTAAPVKRGQPVATAAITHERRDVLALRDPPAMVSSDDPSVEFLENIPTGQPILARSLRLRPVIQRGRLVDATVLDGGLSIGLKVEALDDGLLGQTIRVRNPRTRRELFGKVTSEDTILIGK